LVANLGLYLPSSIEFPTTITELIVIVKPASMGSHPNIPTPRKGTKTPPAIGINPNLTFFAESLCPLCSGGLLNCGANFFYFRYKI
jgi:hypothetical protein